MIYTGDCRDVLATFAANSFDSIVTDPPYGLEFMGKDWDQAVPGPDYWRAALRVAKPGAYLVAFGGTRTFHRLMVAIEDAGWEIRDTLMWVYGQGMPKSHDVSKAIDKALGAQRTEVVGRYQPPGMDKPWNLTRASDARTVPLSASSRNNLDILAPATAEAAYWQGWGTALKPAWEPIVLACKPLQGTIAANVLAHGAGGLNIDGCRVAHETINGGNLADNPHLRGTKLRGAPVATSFGRDGDETPLTSQLGRWPANLVHDGSDEVLAAFPDAPGQLAKASTSDTQRAGQNCYGTMKRGSTGAEPRAETDSSAARFFYCAKATPADREDGCDALEAKAFAYSNQALADVKRGVTAEARSSGTNSVKMRKNTHPTVKPTALMQWLCRLVTPAGGHVLDPFAGSGSTGRGAVLEGFRFTGVELKADHAAVARARIAACVQAEDLA